MTRSRRRRTIILLVGLACGSLSAIALDRMTSLRAPGRMTSASGPGGLTPVHGSVPAPVHAAA